jgi:hypothetical protein
MKNNVLLVIIFSISIQLCSCKKDEVKEPMPNSEVEEPIPNSDAEPRLIFKFKFDSTQVRLDNLGNPSILPPVHGAQSPHFNKMSAHYIEMTPNQWTALGGGTILYHAPETNVGGSEAIDFSQSNPVGDNETFFSMPLKDVTAGTYEWLRVSLAYQNYDISLRYNWNGINLDMRSTIASFIGFNTYISNLQIKDSTIAVNSNKAQGFWAFETIYSTSQGQAPAGSTTVPNPLFATSPIPQGSCLVTGDFDTPLSITGNETEDIVVTVSLSTNNSFEWIENSTPGFFEPAAGDAVVDMGIRGMKVYR